MKVVYLKVNSHFKLPSQLQCVPHHTFIWNVLTVPQPAETIDCQKLVPVQISVSQAVDAQLVSYSTMVTVSLL